jgi:AbrB family looped-hinge helix DNA binding protein
MYYFFEMLYYRRMVKPMETRATEKGQIVIPAALRKKYGIKKGTRIRVFEKDDQIILNPLTPQFIRQKIEELYGSVKGGPSLTKELEAERARDKEKEESRIERRSRLR